MVSQLGKDVMPIGRPHRDLERPSNSPHKAQVTHQHNPEDHYHPLFHREVPEIKNARLDSPVRLGAAEVWVLGKQKERTQNGDPVSELRP